ncbi:MAG TPA: TIR domain-containing protein [Anaerolineales bacterium]|nr:TIR domain-containing protein [Anaerolineales bacterium]HLO32570.1 TIR domain-containing protein [Anaerolineales bacterium]
MSATAPYFFMSYSREDANLQRRVIAELRGRGINVWVDIENLIPGSPAWEREIERSIRGAAGAIVLLSPESNNSEWVRREISFAEQHEMRIFPVLISGDEDDSVPLRLSNHQRVDLRRNFQSGLDELVNALNDHLGVTAVHKRLDLEKKTSLPLTPASLKKLALPGLFAILGLACLGLLVFAARFIYDYVSNSPTQIATTPANIPTDTPADTDPLATDTAVVIDTNLDKPAGKIVYTCQIRGDEICIINADGSGWRQLTNSPTANYYGSLSPDGQAVLFIGKETGSTEIYEMDLSNGKTKQLTHLEKDLGSPEISPDNKLIAFTYRAKNNAAQIWIMNRDGSDPHKFYGSASQEVHDPAWSPDGTQILFAMGRGENNKLYLIGFDGRDPQVINDSIDTRGRSDWSNKNLIAFDMGGPFQHDVYVMNNDGSNLNKLSNGNNSQGASFSPDGEWIGFTAYTDVANKDQASCEIYIMRVDRTNLRRLTKNNYCDYQPRWGK